VGNVQFTGALMPNGIPGSPGQVLVSQGSGAAPKWQTLDSDGNVIVEDEDWLVAANSPTGSPHSVPNNIDQWIYTNGRVGIGTSEPLRRLHVEGGWIRVSNAELANSAIQLETHSGFHRIAFNQLRFWDWDAGGDMVTFENGNVGIGTAAPTATLHVKGTAYFEGTASGAPGVFAKLVENGGAGRLYLGKSNLYNGTEVFMAGFGSTMYFDTNGPTALSVWVKDGFLQVDKSLTVKENAYLATVSGRVGIGTTGPHSAAILQLQATDKGFLPTRVALTSAISWSPLVGTPVDGMLVYNTATAGTGQNTVSPGYYYWFAGRWRRLSTYGYEGMIQGVLYSQPQNLTVNWTSWQYLNSYIDLPPGKWIVYSVQLLNPTTVPTSGSVWVRTKFSDHPSNGTTTADYVGNSFYISGLLPNSAKWSLVTGQIIINNTSGTTKRYYYHGSKEPYGGYNADLVNFSTTLWNENQLYALPAD